MHSQSAGPCAGLWAGACGGAAAQHVGTLCSSSQPVSLCASSGLRHLQPELPGRLAEKARDCRLRARGCSARPGLALFLSALGTAFPPRWGTYTAAQGVETVLFERNLNSNSKGMCPGTLVSWSLLDERESFSLGKVAGKGGWGPEIRPHVSLLTAQLCCLRK